MNNNRYFTLMLVVVSVFNLVSCCNRVEKISDNAENQKNVSDNNKKNCFTMTTSPAIDEYQKLSGNDSVLLRTIEDLVIEDLDTTNIKRKRRCDFYVESGFVFYPFGVMFDYSSLEKKFNGYNILHKFYDELDVFQITNDKDTLLFYYVETFVHSWKSMEIAKASINSDLRVHNILQNGMSKKDICRLYPVMNIDVVELVDTCAFHSVVDEAVLTLVFSEDKLHNINIKSDFVLPD